MITNNLEADLLEYLNKNYFFVQPEIYSHFNLKPSYFFVHKKDSFFNKNKEQIENLNHIDFLEDNIFTNNWRKYEEKNHIKWFASEFKLKGLKYKSKETENTLREIFKNFRIAKKLILPEEIKKIIKTSRIDTSKTKTIENESERKAQEVNVNDKIYFNEDKSKFSNPGIVISMTSDKDLKILYFTNLGEFHRETNLQEINGWCVHRVTNIEIGKTPEEAKENSYL